LNEQVPFERQHPPLVIPTTAASGAIFCGRKATLIEIRQLVSLRPATRDIVRLGRQLADRSESRSSTAPKHRATKEPGKPRGSFPRVLFSKGSEQIDDQETDYRPHCFWRAHCSHRGHLCCRRCSAMVGRDDLRPCSARGHCSRHGSSHCRVSKFQHANSQLENSTSPSTPRDRKTRRDNPPPSSAVSKNATDPSGWWSHNEEDRVHLLNAHRRQTFAGMSDSPLVGMNRDALHHQLELARLPRRFRHSVRRRFRYTVPGRKSSASVLRLAPQALSHDSSPLQALRRPDGGEIIEFRHSLGARRRVTQGCFDDVNMWMSGGHRSGSSSVPTRTKRTARPAWGSCSRWRPCKWGSARSSGLFRWPMAYR
jgi:hypothetical protein